MKPQYLAIAAAVAWCLAAVSFALLEALPDHRYVLILVFKAAAVIAGSLGIVLLVWIDDHVGGLGWVGKTGVVFVGIGVAISAVTWGAVNVYLLTQGIGYLLFGIMLIRTRVAPTVSTVIVSGAFFTAPIAFLIADAAEIGTANEFGDRDAAFAIGLAVGAAFMATGLLGWARWLEHEARDTGTAETHPART